MCKHRITLFTHPLQAGTEHKALTLTRKAALVEAAAAGKLPATLEAAKKGRVMPGYIASITKDAVFVRWDFVALVEGGNVCHLCREAKVPIMLTQPPTNPELPCLDGTCVRLTGKLHLKSATQSFRLSHDTLQSLLPCRFLGALTARVGLIQLSDGHVSDPAAVYSPGQTIRAKVVGVDAASGHVSAELKQSTCASAHAEYLASYFK